MANDRTALDAGLGSESTLITQLTTDVNAMIARLKTPIDYTTEVNQINAMITALTSLDTLAKSQ